MKGRWGDWRALAAAVLVIPACVYSTSPAQDEADLEARAIDFVAPSQVDLGATPTALVVADLDGDGLPDLAAAAGTKGVSVALRKAGGFAPPTAYATGEARGLVAGDFDGDGKPDLVVATADGIALLRGKGDGSFAAAERSPVDSVLGPIVAGDFDRDGKLDVAVMVAGGRVAVLLGKGDGSFRPATSYGGLSGRTMLVAGDVDGDGKTDFVIAGGAGRVLALLGNGDGTFRSGPVTQLGIEDIFYALAAGDLDGDGKLDLAVARASRVPDHLGSIGVARGSGDGTFHWTDGTSDFNRSKPSAVALVDLDGDGKLDVVADIAKGGILVTVLGKGDGTLGAIAYHRSAGPPLGAAGLDGDGRVDVVAANGAGVAVTAGNGDGTLRAARAFQIGGEGGGLPGRVAVGDFNRDGIADVAVTYNNTTTTHVDVLLGDGRGGLRWSGGYGLGDTSERGELAAFDVDGDGILDLVDVSELKVLLGNGDGSFRMAPRSAPLRANGLQLGDFDGDAKVDAVVYRAGQGGLTLVPGNGDGTFARDRQRPIAVDGGINSVVAADLDGDGHLDLAVGTSGTLVVLLGQGDGSFVPAPPIAGIAATVAVAAGDLNGDGRLDLVVAHDGEQVSTALLNQGGGVFRVGGTVPSAGRLRVADVDGDGIADLLVHGGVLAAYRGKGDGTFEPARVYGEGGRDFGLAYAAKEGGRPDIVVALPGPRPFVTVLRNASINP